MAISNKLEYLNDTKNLIKKGLNDLGADLTDASSFRSYANVLSGIYDDYPKVTGEDTDLSLSLTKQGKLKITPKGSSSQFSTTGKQLFNKTDYEYLDNANVSSSSVINIESNFALIYIYLPSDTYTISNDIGSYQWLISDCNEIPAIGTSTSPRQVTTGTSVTYTMNSTGYLLIRVAKNSFSISDFVNKLQIEQGATATLYEPYTGGIPAPNPSYPYPVKVVTGDNEVLIRNKNLFDFTGETHTSGANVTIDNNKLTIEWTAGFDCDLTDEVSNLDSSKTYTVSFKHEGDSVKIKNIAVSNDNLIITGINDEFTTCQFTVTNITDFEFRIVRDTSSGLAIIKDIQIEEGTTATEYVEHESQNYPINLGSIELNSSPDGTICDTIIGTPGNWVKREYIGKVVFDGSESWEDRPSYASADRFVCINLFINSLKLLWSTHFAIANNISLNTYPYIVNNYRQAVINFNEKNTTNLTDFKNWLSTNKPQIYYPLTQYIDIPITDTTLINQLNDIYNNAHSYNGATNITSTYTSGNEQIVIKANALLKNQN